MSQQVPIFTNEFHWTQMKYKQIQIGNDCTRPTNLRLPKPHNPSKIREIFHRLYPLQKISIFERPDFTIWLILSVP